MIREFAGRAVSWLRSLKLTASVLAGLIIMYILGLVVPQKWMFSGRLEYEAWADESLINGFLDALQLTDVYSSAITIALLSLFFLNLITVTAFRAPVMLRRAYLLGEKPAVDAEALMANPAIRVELPGKDPEHALRGVAEYFRKRLWHIVEGEGAMVAVRNRFSPIGFLLFHLSFILCLVGGLTVYYTRFSGNIALTEGQEFAGDLGQFREIKREPKVMKGLKPFGLRLLTVRPRYEADIPSHIEAEVEVWYEGQSEFRSVRVNEPIKKGAYSIIVQTLGISPLFEVLSPDGSVIDSAYVSLKVLNGETDTFRFHKDSRYLFSVVFYPDFAVEDGIEKTRSLEIRNPVMRLKAEEDGSEVFNGLLRPGEVAEVPHFRFRYSDIRYWVDFMVVREYGGGLLIAGFALASIGLLMRLVFFQKTVKCAVAKTAGGALLYMDGHSEYFRHSFKTELEEIAAKLVQELK